MTSRGSVTDQPTLPDVNALWAIFRLVDPDAARIARWRITYADWDHIRLDPTLIRESVVQRPLNVDDPWTLFGMPVDLVPTERHRFPELVLVSDRRR